MLTGSFGFMGINFSSNLGDKNDYKLIAVGIF